jgi:HAD superfamily hydrolase (TIGR01509 family)
MAIAGRLKPMAKRELEALLFDVDGTLAETERDGHRVAFNLAFAELGLGWDWEPALYGELLKVTGGKERLEAWLRRLPPGAAPEGDRGELIDRIHRVKTRHFVELVRVDGLPLRPGVERLLREARDAGLRLAIATTTTPANVVALLSSALGPESIGWFEVIAAGDVVQAKKPAPDIYRHALERLELPATACLAIEDSANGLAAARAAGLEVLVTRGLYSADEDLRSASLVLSDLGEPGQPCEVLHGGPGPDWVDVAWLRAWFAKLPGV